jgi:hypothetical protein
MLKKFLLLVFVAMPLSLFSMGMFDGEDIMATYESMDGSRAIGFLPPYMGSGLDNSLGDVLIGQLALEMIESNSYKPMSLNVWARGKYGNSPAASMTALLQAVRADKLPLTHVAATRIVNAGSGVAIRISIYPLEQGQSPRHFVRFIDNVGGWGESSLVSSLGDANAFRSMGRFPALQSMHKEIDLRLKGAFNGRNLLDKKIFVNAFDMSFNQFIALSSWRF